MTKKKTPAPKTTYTLLYGLRGEASTTIQEVGVAHTFSELVRLVRGEELKTPEGWGYKIVASEAVPSGLKVLRSGRATSYTRKTSGGDVQLLIELRGFEYAIPILVM